MTGADTQIVLEKMELLKESAMTSPVLIKHENAVLNIVLNRPERLNALNTEMLDLAADAVESAWNNPGIRAVVLTGSGRAFSAGADIAELAGGGPDISTIDAANRLTTALRQVPKPVVAAVNGPAVGVGCSIAVAADLVVARESAYFLLAFANIGLMPDGGATLLVPAKVGMARAARMAMLAERIPAQLALDWGLISHIVPDGDFDTEIGQLTTRLAEGPTLAYAQTKRALNMSSLVLLERALAHERAGQSDLFGSDDYHEGVRAFREKRRPNFSGK
ncbi:enoyl-CoA hydratase [Nocardia fluminea]|uniref:enoyl-CoA hydratase n=1 Tax=Nocardia fluminea TaxID=134984 RepID=UPI003825C453